MKRTLLFFLSLFLMQAAFAQSGTIQGTITDEIGLGLPGANIYIASLERGAVTDLNGDFQFVDVAPGTYEMEITFLGYNSVTESISVTDGATAVFAISLEPGVVFGEEVLVLGDRLKGQAKALNQQKTNQNITNIVAADQIGRFPDANIGDAVKRIPGITIQGDQGEARNIIVRGLAPQLNAVTINGDRIPSAEGDNRNVQLDLIPADMIQTIEVSKAVTPDMDADAIGGSVNLVTRPAPYGYRLSVTGASGLNFLTNQPIWTGSLIVGSRTDDGKFGWMLSTSYNDHDGGSDNFEAEWSNEAESPLTEEDIEVDPYLTDLEIRTYLVRRVRRSASLNLDYKFNPNNTIYFRTMYNWRDDWENRFRLRYTDIEPVFQDGTENVIGFEGVGNRETKGGIGSDRVMNRRLEDQRMQNYSLSGEHLLGSATLTWMGSFARASEERPNERYMAFEVDGDNAFPVIMDISDPRFPLVTPQKPNEVTNDLFELDEITEEFQFTSETDLNGRIDLELPVFLGNNQGFVKVGARYRGKEKERNNASFFEYSPVDGIETLADVPLSDQTKDDFLGGDQYDAGQYADPEYLGGLDLLNGSLFEQEDVPDEYLPANFNANETILGGYLMWNQDLSDKFSVLAGVRVENTDLEYIANETRDGEELIQQVTATDNYTNILPGVHLKYNFNANSILRAAWTNTLARPNYYDLAPFRDVVEEDEEVFAGNPELEPTTSMNFDLMFENYFKSVGLVSAGVFYKNVDNFIYVNQGTDATTGFDLFQPLNGGTANVTGFEFAFQRQLDFLPGALKGLGVYANYTFLTSDATGIRNEDGEEREGLDLPGTAPHMVNASLSFETKKLVLRASLNFAAAYIDEVGDSDFTDRYYDQQLFLDFNGSYAFTDNFRFFVELNNITNQPLRYYQGIAERSMQVEYYNMRLNAGLKYDIFKKK